MNRKIRKQKRYNAIIRKVLVILLTSIFCAYLTGCADQVGKTAEPETGTDIPTISIENITLSGKNTVTEEMEARINEITVPTIGCRVHVVDCPIAEHESLLKRIRAGIIQVDLVETGLTASLSALVSNGLLLPLDELLETYGSQLQEKEGRLLEATKIAGTLYALPANLYCGRAEGIGYNAEIADAYHLDMTGEMNLEKLTEIGRSLKEADSGIYLTTQGDGSLSAFSSFYDIETFGGDFAYGGILTADDASGETQVINLYETQEYRSYCRTLQRWREEGLMPSDSLLNGRNGQAMFNQAETFFQFSSVSPLTRIATKRKHLDFEEAYIPLTGNRIKTELVQEFAWGITSGCAYPEKAMELLNLLFQNAELSNLMQFGREGIEYTLVGDGIIRLNPVEEGGTGYSTYFSAYGDTALQYRYETDVEITLEDIRKHAAEAEVGPTFGYVFNTGPVADEITGVLKVTEEYRPILEKGLADDVDALLDEFIQKLKEAGIDQVIQENQRQLNEWKESHY